MVNEVIDGVCKKLVSEFGESVKVYSDNTARKSGVLDSKSALREPNFYVSCKSPASKRAQDRYFTSRQFLGNRYLRSAALCVECRWFPDWQSVLDRLFVCLEYVEISDSQSQESQNIRGSDMQGEYDDEKNTLFFYVSYDVFVYQEEVKSKMEKISLKEELLWH